MSLKKIDIIGNIYNNVIKGVNEGNNLIMLQGSARSGKTYNVMIFLIQCAISQKVLISVVRLALPSLKRSVFRDFIEIMCNMGIYDPKRINKTDMTYTFDNGSVIEFFATADNEQKVRGPSRDILFCNEANELSEWEFNQLKMRTRLFTIMDFNPSFTEEHWIFSRMHAEKTYYFKSTFIDNPFLTDAIRDELLSYKYTNPALWRIFGEGEFAIVEGLVFPKENWDICSFEDIPINIKTSRIGIDIGYSGKGDPTAAIRCWYSKDKQEKHMWVHEIVYEKGINERMLSYRLKMYNDIPKFIDSANPLFIQNLEDAGITLLNPVKKYANSIVEGIQKMQGYHIHVTRTSVNVIKELKNYCWMKDRHEQFTNVPIDKFNHACFGSEVMVSTTTGLKKISEVEIGDVVYNSYGKFPVAHVFHNGIQELWDMTFITTDGQKIELSITPNHKIKTSKGWKQAQDMEAGDVIYLANPSMVKSTICTLENHISQEGQNDYIESYGSTITDQSPKGFISTTKTKTLGTILSTILNVFKVVIIYLCTFKKKCKAKSLLKNCEIEWIMREYMQANGMEAKRGLNGIENMESELQKICSRKNILVCIVARNFGKNHSEKINSAQITANQHGGESRGMIMKQGSAKSVGKSLLPTSILKQELVVPHALASVKVRRKYTDLTYNLEIFDKHEYMANNLVVSNCDAIRYATMGDRSGRGIKTQYTKSELGFNF